MNILSHYFLEEESSSPYCKLGALMPDVIPEFNRKLRKAVFRYDNSEVMEHRQIFEGIRNHYAADATFHGSDFFRHYTQHINSRIQESPLPSVRFRSYFLAHVFLELMLDRLLVKQYPSLPVRIYAELESVNPEVAASYFSRIGKPGLFSEFFDNFNRLLNARHLPLLADNEMYVHALLRAYQKINPAYPGREELKTLMDLTDEIENKHRHELLGIFEAMRQSYCNS